MMQKLCKNILNRPKFNEIKNFICADISFEEIPIIDRYKDIDFLKEHILISDHSSFLLNLSLFLLYNIHNRLKKSMSKEDYNDYFACITLCNPDDERNDIGFIIPNIFVSRKSKVSFLSKETNVSIKDNIFLNTFYGSLIDDGMFSCYETITKNDYGDVIRTYIVPNYMKLH